MNYQSIFMYVTFPSHEIAQSVVCSLLEKKIIACANFLPINSMYTWEGKIASDQEIVAIIKTFDSYYDSVVELIQQSRPYEVPCIIKFPVVVNDAFYSWMRTVIN